MRDIQSLLTPVNKEDRMNSNNTYRSIVCLKIFLKRKKYIAIYQLEPYPFKTITFLLIKKTSSLILIACNRERCYIVARRKKIQKGRKEYFECEWVKIPNMWTTVGYLKGSSMVTWFMDWKLASENDFCRLWSELEIEKNWDLTLARFSCFW